MNTTNRRSLWGNGIAILLIAGARASAQTGIAGIVKDANTGRPIAGADVTIEALRRQTTSDADGHYRLVDLPAGTSAITARHVGYVSAANVVVVDEGQLRSVDIELAPVPTTLDTVAVKGSRRGIGVGLEGFADRQRLGFGKFIDSVELRRNDHRHVGDMLRGFASLHVVHPPVCGGRSMNCVITTNYEVAMSGTGGCSLQVMLDGTVVSRGGPVDGAERGADPRHDWPSRFDLTSVAVGSLAAMEVYPRGGEVPMVFQDFDTKCGLLVLWTRR